MSDIVLPYIDNSSERSSVAFSVAPTISDANNTELYTAVIGVTVGGEQQLVFVQKLPKDGSNNGASNNPLAQRENKFLVRMTETGGRRTNREIPCADLSLLAGSDELSLASGAGLTLKTAIEQHTLGPSGLAVVVNSIKFVGRKT